VAEAWRQLKCRVPIVSMPAGITPAEPMRVAYRIDAKPAFHEQPPVSQFHVCRGGPLWLVQVGDTQPTD
jgi:hypothetical protein